MEKKRTNKNVKVRGNGEGTIYFSETLNKYVAQYVEPSTGKRKTLTQRKNEGKKEFKDRFTKVINDINQGTYIATNKDTFISILEKYVEQKHKDGITSDRSYGRELLTLTQIKKTCSNFTNKPIQKISVEDIEKSKDNMREYANSVIDKIWLCINKTFQIAYSRRKIQYNIMLDETLTKPISKKENKKIEALSKEEENKLINILNNEEQNHKYRDIILLQLYTGMRIGEVLALSTDCIDLQNNSLTVHRTLTQDENYKVKMGEHTKTYKKRTGIDNGKRTFPMNNNTRNIILKILKNKTVNINGLLFWNNKKNTYITPSEINSYLHRINKKYNICLDSLHSHRLRHTFITRCVECGMFPKVIQNLVGHVKGSSITSDIYTSISNDFIQQELKKLN